MPAERQAKHRAPRWKRKCAHLTGYTDERGTAEELGLCLRTLRKWRQLGIGPAYVKVGKQVLYPDEPRAAWLRSRVVQPIRELNKAA